MEEIKNGRLVVVVDSESRENEGDLVLAAEKVTPCQSHSIGQIQREERINQFHEINNGAVTYIL